MSSPIDLSNPRSLPAFAVRAELFAPPVTPPSEALFTAQPQCRQVTQHLHGLVVALDRLVGLDDTLDNPSRTRGRFTMIQRPTTDHPRTAAVGLYSSSHPEDKLPSHPLFGPGSLLAFECVFAEFSAGWHESLVHARLGFMVPRWYSSVHTFGADPEVYTIVISSDGRLDVRQGTWIGDISPQGHIPPDEPPTYLELNQALGAPGVVESLIANLDDLVAYLEKVARHFGY